MAEFKPIGLAQIHVPERLRSVEDDHALAIQASIVEHGLINPITVRSTPNRNKGAQPYTLVAGAHRLRAMELLDEEAIDCLVVEADEADGQLIEIEENVFRNELSVLDRAVFIQTYRDIWEKKFGYINPKGGRPKNSVNLAELMEQEVKSGFSRHVAERLGFSPRSVERANQIARNLSRDLRDRLRGTPAADNQSQLLKLAQLPPAQRKKAVKALDETGGDLAKALVLLEDKPNGPLSKDAKHLSRLIDTWDRAGPKARTAFMKHAGLAPVEGPGG